MQQMLYNFVVSTAEQFTKKKTRFDAKVYAEKTDPRTQSNTTILHKWVSKCGWGSVFSEWTIYMWQVRRKPQALPQTRQCSGHTEVGHDHARCKSDRTAKAHSCNAFDVKAMNLDFAPYTSDSQLQKKAEVKYNQKGVLQAIQRLWL